MIVCGVELIGNEAIIAILKLKNGLYEVPKVRTTKLVLSDGVSTEAIKKLQFDFAQLMKDYQVTDVVIKQRALKGKYAGTPLSFKIEGALQLMANVPAEVITATYIKEGIAKAQIRIDVCEAGLKKFQDGALQAAFGYIEQHSNR